MFLNNSHINQKVPPGVFGGAMCRCKSCQEKYWSNPKQEIDMLKIMQEAQVDKEYEQSDTKDQIAKIMLLHGTIEQQKEAMEYIKCT